MWYVPIIWTRNSRGKEMIIVNGYTFCRHSKQQQTFKWICTLGYTKCQATVNTFEHQVILIWARSNRDKEIIIVGGYTFSYNSLTPLLWIRNSKGKDMCVVNGFSFYRQKEHCNTIRWKCTSSLCKSAFTTTHKNDIIRSNLYHSHMPPFYTITN
ncbi:hypothetical protein MSG28_008201, partial [Choristoneura fumiferana]